MALAGYAIAELFHGGHPARRHCRTWRTSSRRVEITGYHADAIAIIKTFDLFVRPSLEEGVPRCLMEAIAARVPVIASDIPGNRERVEHAVTGLLLPPEQPTKLADAVPATIAQPDRAKAMARRARTMIENRYSAAILAAEYTVLCRECRRS